MMEDDKKELLINRIFDSPRERVWEAWTDPIHLAKWWGPANFTNPVCEVELWPGGTLRINTKGPDGIVLPMMGTFEEVDKPHRLVFKSTAFPDENGESQWEIINTVTFEDEDEKTKLTLVTEVMKAEGSAVRFLEGQNISWNQSLDKLASLLCQEDVFLGGKYPNEFINF